MKLHFCLGILCLGTLILLLCIFQWTPSSALFPLFPRCILGLKAQYSNAPFVIMLSYIKIGSKVYLQAIEVFWFLFLIDKSKRQSLRCSLIPNPETLFTLFEVEFMIDTTGFEGCFSLKKWFCYCYPTVLHLAASDLWRKSVKY